MMLIIKNLNMTISAFKEKKSLRSLDGLLLKTLKQFETCFPDICFEEDEKGFSIEQNTIMETESNYVENFEHALEILNVCKNIINEGFNPKGAYDMVRYVKRGVRNNYDVLMKGE